jgi:hypothetical protein
MLPALAQRSLRALGPAAQNACADVIAEGGGRTGLSWLSRAFAAQPQAVEAPVLNRGSPGAYALWTPIVAVAVMFVPHDRCCKGLPYVFAYVPGSTVSTARCVVDRAGLPRVQHLASSMARCPFCSNRHVVATARTVNVCEHVCVHCVQSRVAGSASVHGPAVPFANPADTRAPHSSAQSSAVLCSFCWTASIISPLRVHQVRAAVATSPGVTREHLTPRAVSSRR